MKRNRILMYLLVFLVCLISSGCSNEKHNTPDIKTEIGNNDTEEMSDTILDDDTDKESEKQAPLILKTEKEKEEYFGKTDKAGKWTPPEGSKRDKYGNIVNKYGDVIELAPYKGYDPGAKG